MRTLKGAEVSARIKGQVTQMMEGLEGPASKLATTRVGEEPNDISYKRGAVKKMENFGLRAQTYVFPEQIGDSDFKAGFSVISRDPNVSGILLLRPLPEQAAETNMEKVVSPEKDLSGISPANIARVFTGDKTDLAPCTAEAAIEVLKANEIGMTGKNVTIVGYSVMVERLLSMLMLKENATVTICHTRIRSLGTECRRAEILVVTAEKAKMLDGHYVGQSTIVINVGINVGENEEICGDADFQSIEPVASVATPVSGGVGAMTTAVLAKHPMLADQRQRRNQMGPSLIPVFSSC